MYVNNMKKTRYVLTWRNKWIMSQANSIDDFIDTFESLAKMLKEWKEMEIKLDPDSSIGDDYAEFYTNDMDAAIKAGFTVYIDDEETTEYLVTAAGERIRVPKKNS